MLFRGKVFIHTIFFQNIDVSSSNRKDWPLAIMRKVLQELVHETPQDLLEK